MSSCNCCIAPASFSSAIVALAIPAVSSPVAWRRPPSVAVTPGPASCSRAIPPDGLSFSLNPVAPNISTPDTSGRVGSKLPASATLSIAPVPPAAASASEIANLSPARPPVAPPVSSPKTPETGFIAASISGDNSAGAAATSLTSEMVPVSATSVSPNLVKAGSSDAKSPATLSPVSPVPYLCLPLVTTPPAAYPFAFIFFSVP